jgi:hypothetical protein
MKRNSLDPPQINNPSISQNHRRDHVYDYSSAQSEFATNRNARADEVLLCYGACGLRGTPNESKA